MPRIAPHFVSERLIPAIDIVEFIGRYVQLKKSGSNYTCCCPFHQEKTPSFSVSPAKQMFYCFGCKEHGTVVSFLMKLKNLRFPDAVEQLSGTYGIEVEYERSGGQQDSAQSFKYKTWYTIMDDAAAFFQRLLLQDKHARNYCSQERGLSAEIITKFRLGYAPDRYEYFREGFIDEQHPEGDLVTLGLLKLNGQGSDTYCRFRNRIMIPILDTRGRVIGFGGRLIPRKPPADGRSADFTEPKYINSPTDSPLFKKGRVVFGLHEALRSHNNALQQLVLVEGYMDVIALAMAGIDYAAAAMGTATTAEQLREIFWHTSHVVFCYDGDAAGRSAAWRALENVTPFLSETRSVRFAFLPEGEDPDSLVRSQGAGAFEQVIARSMPYAEYLVTYCRGQHNLADSNQLSVFISKVIGLIARIPADALRMVTLRVLAKTARVPEEQLYAMLSRAAAGPEMPAAAHNSAEVPAAKSTAAILTTPMRRLMAFMLQQPQVVATLINVLELGRFVDLAGRLGVPGIGHFASYLAQIEDREDLSPAVFLERSRGTSQEGMVERLIEADLGLPEAQNSDDGLRCRSELFVGLLTRVLLGGLEERRHALESGAAQLGRDDENLIYAVQRVQQLRFTN